MLTINADQLNEYARLYAKIYGITPCSDDVPEQAIALANLLSCLVQGDNSDGSYQQ